MHAYHFVGAPKFSGFVHSRGDDDGLSRCRGSKLLREIHPDRQRRSLDSHLNVLHDGILPRLDSVNALAEAGYIGL